MRTLCECTWEIESDGDEPAYKTGEFILLHWGLQYTMQEIQEGKIIPVNYTVGVCQDTQTGQIRCFLPENIRILGRLLGKE